VLSRLARVAEARTEITHGIELFRTMGMTALLEQAEASWHV
jgi:hypothetical protein